MGNKARKARTVHDVAVAPSRSSSVGLLLSTALAIPGLALSEKASAQSFTDDTELRFGFTHYEDSQSDADRIKVDSPMVWFRTPVGSEDEVVGSFVYDTVSGASPWYLNSISGASGLGVEESRKAGDLMVNHRFDQASVGLGGSFSTENDYDSLSAKTEIKFWTPDKNTTLALGASADFDRVGSSIDSELSESKNTENFLLGVTQIINPLSFVQMNLTFGNASGYLNDPYKILDNRPSSRQQWAWMTRYRLFLPQFDAAFHADYRFYWDSFGVNSHMIEVALYQPLFSTWTIRPTIRYYSQNKADFFEGVFPPTDGNRYFSADQRLADFGSITAGIKVIKDFGGGYSAEIGFDFMEQNPDWKVGSAPSNSVEAFYAQFFYAGIMKKF